MCKCQEQKAAESDDVQAASVLTHGDLQSAFARGYDKGIDDEAKYRAARIVGIADKALGTVAAAALIVAAVYWGRAIAEERGWL